MIVCVALRIEISIKSIKLDFVEGALNSFKSLVYFLIQKMAHSVGTFGRM